MDDKRLFGAKVLSNIALGSVYYRVTFLLDKAGGEAFRDAVPGQFAELDISGVALPADSEIPDGLEPCAKRQIILRRPFSFSDIRIDGSNVEVDVLYCVLGPATVRMTTLQRGDPITIIGPLGNGFNFDKKRKYALLVAGGMGAPPMQHLAVYFEETYPEMQVIGFAGARSKEDLPFTLRFGYRGGLELEEYSTCDKSYIATDDGSAGHKGFVSQCVEQWLEQVKPAASEVIFYACGPEPMLASVADIAVKNGIECQVSMERMMACGIGLCQSCVVESKATGNYKLCCKDGPVFDAKDVVFE